MKSKFVKVCVGAIAISVVGLAVCTVAMKRGVVNGKSK